MCAISGYYSDIYKTSPDEFKLALNSMTHRGPDATDTYCYKNLFVGHNRLSIIDLSNQANQPMHSDCGKYIIVFNGEIYNYKELQKQYNIKQSTNSDTETLLKLYSIVGEKLPELLNGMFAFAIYDKNKNEIFIARDKFGIKPLFYYCDDSVFAFSSELKALLNYKYIKSKIKLNYLSIKRYLHLGYIPSPLTIYNNIYKFPASTFAVYKNNNLKFEKYYDFENTISNDVLKNENDALNKLETLLTDSIKIRLQCDVAFGTLLSGGNDSGLITALAAKNSSSKINTYTIGFSEQSYNEAPFAKQIANYLNTTHHEFIVSENDAIKLIPEILTSYDEPFADSSALPTMLVSKMASNNVKMVLSGDGGDELFHGYGAYKWANRFSNTAFSLSRKTIANTLKYGNNRQKRVSHLLSYNNNYNIYSHIFSQEQYFFSEPEINQICNSPITNCNDFDFKTPELKRKLSPAEKQSLFDLNYYLPDDLLVKVDRASMKYSLEVRVPFLDYRIVEFAYNLHHSLKINNNEQKYILKKLLYKHVPQDLYNRNKKGFSIPLNNWLKHDLKYLIDDNLNKNEIEKHNIFDYNEVFLLIKKFENGDNYLYNRLWNIIILQMFLKNARFL